MTYIYNYIYICIITYLQCMYPGMLCFQQVYVFYFTPRNDTLYHFITYINTQGIVGCTPTNVPLREIPTKALQKQPSKHQLTISPTAKVQAVHRAEARHLRCFWGQDWKNGPNLFKQLGTVAGFRFSPSTVKIEHICIKTAIVIVKVFLSKQLNQRIWQSWIFRL